MSRVIVIDTGPLGLLTHRVGVPDAFIGNPVVRYIPLTTVAMRVAAGIPPADLIVATTNVGHLSRFLAADLWTNI